MLQEQFVIRLLPALDMVFDGQSKHVEDSASPTPVEYLPLAQNVQGAAPTPSLNLPVEQAWQKSPLGPVYPTLQVQFRAEELPANESEFEWHSEQTELASTSEYFPTPQSMHAELDI